MLSKNLSSNNFLEENLLSKNCVVEVVVVIGKNTPAQATASSSRISLEYSGRRHAPRAWLMEGEIDKLAATIFVSPNTVAYEMIKTIPDIRVLLALFTMSGIWSEPMLLRMVAKHVDDEAKTDSFVRDCCGWNGTILHGSKDFSTTLQNTIKEVMPIYLRKVRLQTQHSRPTNCPHNSSGGSFRAAVVGTVCGSVVLGGAASNTTV